MTVEASPYSQRRQELLARSGLTGADRRKALADLTDAWLAGLFTEAGGPVGGAALVAVGGYGRRELSPGSDLDVLLLRGPHLRDTDAAELADRIWYPVWDSGVRLDHAVRTPSEARRVAAEDLRALLGLLDVRHVAGDVGLTEGLRASVLADWRGFSSKRLPELLDSCRERAERSGELAFTLEPDLKESRGGLRDLVVLRAVAASWVTDAPHAGLEQAHETLLDVRDALHTVTGRASDRLALQEQDAVAHQVGLLDADQLLRQVASAGRTVAYALDVTAHRVEHAVLTRRGRSRFVTGPLRHSAVRLRAPLAEGVVEQEGDVVLARDARPAEDPVLVLRAAAAAAQAAMRLSPHTVDRLAAESAPLPQPWPYEARDALVSLLGAGAPAIPVWEALDQAGITTRLIPDWERVRSRPQRNPVHRFTVDRHLVETATTAAAFSRRVSRPDLLLVGALLHDIGKGWPGDHTEAGVAVVADIAPRLGFDPAEAEVLVSLVRYHLLLPDTATRRDLDDPATVTAVAAAVETPENLDLLHALTEADALATGPAAWGEWKAALVADLVARTHSVLRGHVVVPPEPLTPEQQQLARRGDLAVTLLEAAYGLEVTVAAPDRLGLLATVAGVLSLHRLAVRSATATSEGSMAVQVWTVLPEFGSAPDARALREDVRRALEGRLDVADRLRRREESYPDQGHRLGRAVPPARVDVVPGASESATVIEVRAHDRPGLLHRIGASLAAAGVNVLSARVSTLGSDAVDVFYVVGSDGRPLGPEQAREVALAVRGALR
ncbi:MAG TPA: [protein-PII] uridylyltransferase [Actinomycetes bacterium]|nr:[protein-PII] uridylyltransferase [Actinomycetes bacterium]